MFPLFPIFILLAGTNALLQPNPTPVPTNETERKPVICLKKEDVRFRGTNYTRPSVVCIYDDEDLGNSTLEYPELEKLAQPEPRKCFARPIHLQALHAYYYLSWIEDESAESWIDARNFCRKMCMELVSLEAFYENDWLKKYIKHMMIQEFWTSGRLCDFKGCEKNRSPFMWPRNENGWFWTGSEVRIAPYYDAQRADWAPKGSENNRQPDNGAYGTTGKTEACLAIRKNREGIHWHDELCERKMHFICENNVGLIREGEKMLGVK